MTHYSKERIAPRPSSPLCPPVIHGTQNILALITSVARALRLHRTARLALLHLIKRDGLVAGTLGRALLRGLRFLMLHPCVQDRTEEDDPDRGCTASVCGRKDK